MFRLRFVPLDHGEFGWGLASTLAGSLLAMRKSVVENGCVNQQLLPGRREAIFRIPYRVQAPYYQTCLL